MDGRNKSGHDGWDMEHARHPLHPRQSGSLRQGARAPRASAAGGAPARARREASRKNPRTRNRAGAKNAASKEIGEAKKKKDEDKAKGLLIEVAALKESIPAMEAQERGATVDLHKTLAEIPNLPLDEVPDGKDEKDNVERHHFGAKRDYAFTPKQHFDLGEALGQMDFEAAAKLSGARFVVLKKGLARLERALGQFMLDVHTGEHGYAEVNPPLMVRGWTMFGTAQLPKFENDQYLAMAKITSAEAVGAFTSEVDVWRSVTSDEQVAFERYLAHPHRRSPPNESRPRIHHRRSANSRCDSPPARRVSAPKQARREETRAA